MNVAVVVSSCDFFEDCWAPFISSVKKYWADCPWPVFIISNYKEIKEHEGVQFVKVGEDRKFSSNLKLALNIINSDYIIYLQEDYWLNIKVDTDAIIQHVQFCIENDVDYLRLSMPYLKGRIIDKIYKEQLLEQKYALCLQAAIWKRSTLSQLLIDGHSGWDFEYKIQKYAVDHDIKIKALCIGLNYKNKGLNYVQGTAVRKGRWTHEGYRFLIENGFEELLTKRDLEGRVFGKLQEIHGFLRPICMVIIKLMKHNKWNF